ncbi:hypothetical protein EYF80_061500 [Liparis tanakae]|uniref:Uncharacterized protein n=1 Tax=Liparis tanakae TaxID=230148 RepID=A0A4Z2EIA7_9TELE|nr:hypothetical protein EYF80_061500 [Liparis tanakae]
MKVIPETRSRRERVRGRRDGKSSVGRILGAAEAERENALESRSTPLTHISTFTAELLTPPQGV